MPLEAVGSDQAKMDVVEDDRTPSAKHCELHVYYKVYLLTSSSSTKNNDEDSAETSKNDVSMSVASTQCSTPIDTTGYLEYVLERLHCY